jgi:fumarate hydratase class II
MEHALQSDSFFAENVLSWLHEKNNLKSKNKAGQGGLDMANEFRKEIDSLGEVNVPADKLWGAQTQRSLEHFSIAGDLMPQEMVGSYAILKKAAAIVNFQLGQLTEDRRDLIVKVCDEILAGQHQDQFPLYVWMT